MTMFERSASAPFHTKAVRRLSGVALIAAASLSIGALAASGAQAAASPRKACRADFQSLCSGVQPGGGRALACLKQNQDKLSPDCQQALATAKSAD